MASLAGMVGLASAVPERPWERFGGINHISNFTRSGVLSMSALISHGWLETDGAMADPLATPPTASMRARGQAARTSSCCLTSRASTSRRRRASRCRPAIATISARSTASSGRSWPKHRRADLVCGIQRVHRSVGTLLWPVHVLCHAYRRGAGHARPAASRCRCGYDTFTLYPAYKRLSQRRAIPAGRRHRAFRRSQGHGRHKRYPAGQILSRSGAAHD